MRFGRNACLFTATLFLLAVGPGPSTAKEDSSAVTKKEEKVRAKEEKKRGKQLEKERKKSRKKGLPTSTLEGKTAAEWYEEALERIAKKKYYAAREILLPLEEHPKALDIQPEVKLAIADSYFLQKGSLNYSEAQVRYSSFLTFYPNHEKADYAQYRLALCFFKQTNPPQRDQAYTRRALTEFDKLLYKYPNSIYAGDAVEKKKELRQLLGEHEYEVGRFYFLTENWNSAISRFLGLLSDYPEYPKKDLVYHYLSTAYGKIGSLVEAKLYGSKIPEGFKKHKEKTKKKKEKKEKTKDEGGSEKE